MGLCSRQTREMGRWRLSNADPRVKVRVAVMAGHAFLKLLVRAMGHQLGKDRRARVHSPLSVASEAGAGPGGTPRKSQLVPAEERR